MQSILDQITEWLKEMLISGIMGNLSGMFDSVNQQVGEIAGDVGMTPASFSPAVFSLIRNISESVIVPIAGLILTFMQIMRRWKQPFETVSTTLNPNIPATMSIATTWRRSVITPMSWQHF